MSKVLKRNIAVYLYHTLSIMKTLKIILLHFILNIILELYTHIKNYLILSILKIKISLTIHLTIF